MAAKPVCRQRTTGRRRIEDHCFAQRTCTLERMPDCRIGNLELADNHGGRLQHRIKSVDHCRGHCTVGASNDHDGVLTVVIDHDQRHATGIFNRAHRLTIDLFSQQCVTQLQAVVIVANTADHRHLRTQARSSDCLIGALAAGHRGKGMTDQRFTALGQPWCPGDQIHVQAAYYHYICWHTSLLVNSVSAVLGEYAGQRRSRFAQDNTRGHDPLIGDQTRGSNPSQQHFGRHLAQLQDRLANGGQRGYT